MADQLGVGARLLEEMLSTDPPHADKAHEIKEVEHKCDFLTHEIIQRLNKTFVTPIDREDIHSLARTLDDVMDAIDSAAALIPLYRIDKVRPGARELTRVIVQQTDELRRGARLLESMLAVDPPIADKAHEIKEVEHKCDFLTHEIIQRLNKTFVTPIDREDIHELARTLDDVMDAIDNAASLIPLYKIDKVRPGARELTRIIIQQCDEIRVAVEALEQRKGVLERAIEINRLENEADRIHKQAISQLFDEEVNPIVVLKWKELYDLLEEATDACEDVANLLENVVVKHG